MLHGCNFSEFLSYRESHYLPYRFVTVRDGVIFTSFEDSNHVLACACAISDICCVYNIRFEE